MRLWRPGSRQPSCHNQADGITGQPGGIGGTEPGQKSTLGDLLTSGAQAYGKYRLRSGTGFSLDVVDYFPLS